MMPMKPKGAFAEDQAEGPDHEQTEPPMEDQAEGEAPDGSGDSPGETAAGGADPGKQGLFETTLAHVLDVVTQNAEVLDKALQQDPIAATVNIGTSAVRSVIEGATQATGKQIPFDVVLAVGVTLIKKLADIANQKGYLPDEQIETFLKEAFQQSIHKWMGLDEKGGKMTAGQVNQVQRKLGGASGAMMQQ